MTFYGKIDESLGVTTTETVLDEIVAKKRIRIAEQKKNLPLDNVDLCVFPSIPSFSNALQPQKDRMQVIAEFKIASPSKGVLIPEFTPETSPEYFFTAYKEGEASAISVLTEEDFFQGSFSYLERAVEATHLPILCKDFVVDPYQLALARYHGASAILLIVALLEDAYLKDLYEKTVNLGLTALVEVHTVEEAERALRLGAEVIGINNRNLKTFQTSLSVTEIIAPLLKDHALVVSESGIKTPQDAVRMKQAGASALLIGEGCVTAKNISAMVQSFVFC